jgi:hypothetical protein
MGKVAALCYHNNDELHRCGIGIHHHYITNTLAHVTHESGCVVKRAVLTKIHLMYSDSHIKWYFK